jgi:lipoate---protein ligase
VLRVWEWPNSAVILGAGCASHQDINEAACQADHVPVLRRSSGGGTVLLGPGCLLYSLVVRHDREPEFGQIRSSYCFILKSICNALAVPGLRPAGVSDLAQNGLKVSGNAQQRKRECLLHHGTLLYAFDAAKSGHYLRMPVRQPEYRQHRPDAEFLTNLPLGCTHIVASLRQAFRAECEVKVWPQDCVRKLVENKYALAEWTCRRT